ncbi:ABC transporter permease [Rhodococcus sp. W8901]|uniref:ABC transporter permease n=1 Tax=Rhodococcus sp. W8901 TaxID=2742603 RepID=UPI0015842BC4|nr:ABC transporter permease [Rhodococcus sp. W8901]QKT11917.1 ABC transporter permease [Rhodococcus sp. W8901]
MSVLNAERIKLTTTKSPMWCSLIAVVVSIGLSVVIGASMKSQTGAGFANPYNYTAAVTQMGAVQFGAMLVMIMSALAVTTEYRFGVIRTSFLASPNRSAVIAGKALLLAGFAAVLGLVVALAAFYLGQAASGLTIPLGDGDNARIVLGVPIYFALVAVFAVGVGTLIRQSAGAISLVLLWPLVIESMATVIPKVGKYIGEFGPFNNATYFLGQQNGGQFDFHWGPWGALVYFAAFVAVVFGTSLVVVNKRDA